MPSGDTTVSHIKQTTKSKYETMRSSQLFLFRFVVGVCFSSLLVFSKSECFPHILTRTLLFFFGVLGILFMTFYGIIIPPNNSPKNFIEESVSKTKNDRNLVCIGDSITHGNVSGNYVNRVRMSLDRDYPYSSHHWNVINAGTNRITTFTVKKNIEEVLRCKPDFVTILIGSNDIKALFNDKWRNKTEMFWNLESGSLSFHAFEKNVKEIIEIILERTESKIAVLTLPPMGENLTSELNSFVNEANTILKNLVRKIEQSSSEARERLILLDIHQELKNEIEISSKNRSYYHPPENFFGTMILMATLHYTFGLSFNKFSKLVGNVVLSDSIHLNETGGDIIAAAIVKNWINDYYKYTKGLSTIVQED